MATAAATTQEFRTVLARMEAGRDHLKAESRQRYLRNPSLTPAELYDAPTDAELEAKAAAEATARLEFRASPAGQFVGSLDKSGQLLTRAMTALSEVRSARSRADGQLSAAVLARLSDYQAVVAAIQADAILMGVFAAEVQAERVAA